MKKLLFSISVLLSGLSWAQTADLGQPASFKGKLSGIETLPVITTPDFNLQQALYEDSLNVIHWTGPYRFGYEHMVNIDVLDVAKLDQLPNGDKIYRLVLHCPDAYTVNVQFHDFLLPDGARLDLYTYDMSAYIGSYTSSNNNPARQLGSDLLPGDKIVIEYREPASKAGMGVLKLGMIVHGYRNMFTFDNLTGARVNESGNCNMDVICPDGAAWSAQKRSVARILNGGGLCTGALVNNTANNGIPYFLTANHCSPQSMGSAVFRFNYDSPICGTGGNSQAPAANQTVNGSVLRARRTDTDFGLIQLNSTPPANFNVYYAGWDRTGVTSPNAVGIHHPSGDVKKISFDDNALTRTAYSNNTPSASGTHWRVGNWERNTTTEGGSSGSPLFDNNQRVIGQLHGGGAACGNTLPDWYGCFHLSWDGSAANQRLRDWLDPANTTNTLDGYDPNTPSVSNDAGILNVTSPTGVVCASNFTPVVVLRNYGSAALTSVTINYNVDGSTNQTFNWSGNLASGQNTNVTLPTMTTTAGAHTFNAFTTLPNGSSDGNSTNDAALSNFTLTPGGQSVTFALQTDCWGDEITWELRDNSNNLLYSGGPYGPPAASGNAVNQNWCLAYGCYVFTINDSYGDGMYGSQHASCSINGTYSITSGGNTLATLIAPNANFGNQEVNSFCFTDPNSLTANFSPSNNPICIGSSVTFNDISSGAPTSWSWTFTGGTPATSTQQNPTVVYNTAGTFNVSLTVTNAGGSDTYNLPNAISVVATPNVTLTPTNVMFGNDGTITVTGGQAGYTYAWTGPGGFTSSSQNLTGLAAGVYNLTVTSAEGCQQTTSTVVSSSVGLNNIGEQRPLSIFPNPSNGDFMVDGLSRFGSEAKLNVFGTDGRLIHTTNINGADKLQLQLPLATGMYLIECVDSEGKTVSRLIIGSK